MMEDEIWKVVIGMLFFMLAISVVGLLVLLAQA